MNDLILFGKALADSTRIRILAALRLGELCVCELSDALEMSQSTLSTHLQVIRQSNLVVTRKEGKWAYYALEPELLRLLEPLFDYYRASLAADQRLKRDADRILLRLQLRVDGRCTLGPGQL